MGASTDAQDVSKDFSWNAGIRYAVNDGTSSWRLGANAMELMARATHYELEYTTARELICQLSYEAEGVLDAASSSARSWNFCQLLLCARTMVELTAYEWWCATIAPGSSFHRAKF